VPFNRPPNGLSHLRISGECILNIKRVDDSKLIDKPIHILSVRLLLTGAITCKHASDRVLSIVVLPADAEILGESCSWEARCPETPGVVGD